MYWLIGTAIFALFAAISPLNQLVFHTENLDEMRREGRTRLAKAEALIGEQSYEAARESLATIVSRFESKKDYMSLYIVQTAMYYAGTSFRNEFRYDESIRAMNKLVEKYPETPYAEMVFFTNGQSYKDAQKYRAAIEEFEKLERNRAVAREFPKYKNVDLETEKYVDIDKLGMAKKSDNKVKVYTREMQEQEAKGKQQEEAANTLCDAVIEIGSCHLELNETQKARDQYALVAKFFSSSDKVDDAQKFIADSYLREGNVALGEVERVEAGQKKQQIERANAHFQRAVQSYLRFINVYTQSDLIAKAYIGLGDAYSKMGDAQNSKATFERAIGVVKEPEKQARTQLDIGGYFDSEKRWDEAIEAYAKVLQNFSKTQVASNAVYLTGVCYEAKGDTAKAIEYFRDLCSYYKTSQFFPSAAFKLGLNYQKVDDYKQALQYFRAGIQLYPNSPQAAQTQYQIGVLFKNKKEYAAAIEEFQYLVDNYEGEWGSKALFEMVDCYKRMGDMDKAKETAAKIKDNTELVIESYKLLGIGASTPEEELKLWQGKVAEAPDDKAKVASLMEVAQIQLYKLEQFDSAFVNYQTILQLTDDEIRKINAQVGIGQVYVNQGKYEDARKIYQSILDNSKTADAVRVQIEYKVFDSYRREGQFDKAREGFRVFVEKNRANDLAPYAQFSIGVCFSEQKKYDEAIKEYARVLDEFKQSEVFGQTILAAGTAHKDKGEFDEAIRFWLKHLKDTPGLDVAPQIYFQIGNIYKENKQDLSKAIEYLGKVLDFPNSPLFSTAAYLVGDCYAQLNQDSKALSYFEKVKPEDKSIRRAADAEMGKILGKTNPQAAIAAYNRIVIAAETDFERAVAEMGKGDVYTGMNPPRYELAAESFHKVYADYQGAGDTLRGGALVKEIDAYNQLRKFDQVIRLADAMVKEFPSNPYVINAIYFKANAYYSSDRYGKARDAFEDIIKLNTSPEITEAAYYQKADCLLFLKEYDAAVREYKQYIAKYPIGKYVPISIYQMGNSYWAQEDFEKARLQYETVVNKYPDFSEVCSAKGFLGYCLDQIGQWQKARALYNQVLKNRQCQGEARKFAKDQLDKNLVTH